MLHKNQNTATSSNKKVTTFKHAALLQGIACSPPTEAKKLLQSSSQGLSQREAALRLDRLGRNEISAEKNDWRKQLLATVLNRFNLLVMVLAGVSYFTNDLKGAVVMASMVVLSVALTFFQEFRSTKAAQKLKDLVDTKVTVTRVETFLRTSERSQPDIGVKQDVPLAEIVVGDLVNLSAGDIIPGDLKLATAKDLYVNQSTLTGESVPVEKSAAVDLPLSDLLDLKSLCFLGSNVVSGTASGFVIKTGKESYFGSIAAKVLSQRIPTSFDLGVQRFTGLLLKFMLVMVPVVFMINGLTKGNWSEAFLFAVAVAIGLTPEMLPMIVTVNLAKGAMEMARRQVIVKRLGAIQNFGAMDVLCTDKTGTLTEDEVVFSRALNAQAEEDNNVLRLAYLNSSHQTGLKNFLDLALVKHATAVGVIADGYRLLDELPFDFSRKRMSVLVQSQTAPPLLICKGSVEEVISICTQVENQRNQRLLTAEGQQQLKNLSHRLQDSGERLIAIAYRTFASEFKNCAAPDENNLTFLGFLAFADPPAKSTAAAALQVLSQAGVAIKILTGDNEQVTRRVAAAVGLAYDQVVPGSQIEQMSNQELNAIVDRTSLFVKLTPYHKQRIVEALHHNGHVVGFLGDGINDAPALRTADVGISVNNAVDIAKESADIILLQKDLGVLEAGVIEGRKVFGNITKYIRMGASSNFGNVFSVLGASCFLPFLPMLPVQMLIQNLLYDFSQTTIPFDHVDAEYLQRPRKWEIADIGRFMLFLGPVSSLFDYATFGLMWYLFKANSPGQQGLFQAGWFIEGLLSQTLIVHVIRTRKIPFIQSHASKTILVSTIIVMGIGLWLPFSRFGSALGFTAPPVTFFPFLILILIGYCGLAHLTKTWFYQRYGYR